MLLLSPDATALPSEDVNWKIANGRARSRSRRYFVRNRLRFMWVLTFAESRRDRAEVMTLVSEFARRLRSDLGVKALPYWYSPELHPGGHGWHVNFFVPMYLSHARFATLWGHGFVWVTDFEQSPVAPKGEPLGVCRTPREGWRRAAAYGCKYAQKDWLPGVVGAGVHRYEVAQSFAPQVEKSWVDAQSDAWHLVAKLVPKDEWAGLQHWDSNEEPEWDRPPVLVFRW